MPIRLCVDSHTANHTHQADESMSTAVAFLGYRVTRLTFKGYAAIRTVSATVFALFGLGRWLPHERDKATARRGANRRPPNWPRSSGP